MNKRGAMPRTGQLGINTAAAATTTMMMTQNLSVESQLLSAI
jgi:hypothetical protein